MDISKWQPIIDAPQIKADGARFVVLKATQGRGVDPLFIQHRRAFAGVGGVAVDAYHLANCVDGTWGAMTPEDPKAQAKYAADVAMANPVDGHWLDLEPDDSDKKKPPRFFSALVDAIGRRKAAEWVGAWLATFESRAGVECGVYFSPRLAKEGGDELRRVLGDRPLWFAFYQQHPKLPRTVTPGAPDGWDRWDIWQYKADDNKATQDFDESGRCRGVMGGKKACDLNVVNPLSKTFERFMR